MIILDIGFSLILAFIIAMIFFFGFRAPGERRDYFVLFLILFLLIWFGGVWIYPFGPKVTAWQFIWLPFVIISVVAALVLALAVPSRTSQVSPPFIATFNILFWVLLCSLIFFIILGYYVTQRPVLWY